MPATKPIGIIGLGLMGEVYATRLIAGGRAIVGYDIDPARGERLISIGGRAMGSIIDVAHTCDIIVVAVFSTDQVEDVVENHILQAAGPGSRKIVLATSTADPDRIAALGARVASRVRFLETPVSGTSEQVRRGDGVGLIGGDRATAAEVDDVLAILFPRRFHIGRVGDGGRAKLAINLILGLNRLALAEGLVFAQRVGLDLEGFLPVARESAAYSQVMDIKGPRMINGDFKPEGRVRQTLKDVHMMLDLAARLGQSLPALAANCDVLEACVRAGEGELDNSAVIKEIQRRTTAGPS